MNSKPSRNAFSGYTYQQHITFMLLAKMDAKREIEYIEIESIVNHKFDDVKIGINGSLIYCQIKDYEDLSFERIQIKKHYVVIGGKRHKLSKNINILFFKNINIECNDCILGIPAYKEKNLYIVSLSRIEADGIIDELYINNKIRKSIINKFYCKYLDKRSFIIYCKDLPIIDIYSVQLLEETINVGRKHIEFEDILLIEGRPGIGKSHLVESLALEYKTHLLYRFWISNQDRDYLSRLVYSNFLFNISKELFNDFIYRGEDEIIDKLSKTKEIVIIDGFDHVENYKPKELPLYITFIDKLKTRCKTIVLSRPLKSEISWPKQILSNWSRDQTDKILNKLYNITDYDICKKIYAITNGYPILIRFISEHYNSRQELPILTQLDNIDDYYRQVVSSVDIKNALSIFLTSNSYLMLSEFSLFLEDELSEWVKEFIDAYPYLFEKRLNRISLFHDSFNTYLRNTVNYSQRHQKVKQIVYDSLMKGEKRFMSRFLSFELSYDMALKIIKKYASINKFEEIMKDCVDFEAIRSFYIQIRENIPVCKPKDLGIIQYYDLSLILNILGRDHISGLNDFLYTYVKCLQYNEYQDDDITSSEYLFSMYYYMKTGDPTLIYNLMSDDHLDVEHFHEDLEANIQEEENYFIRHKNSIKRNKQLDKFANGKLTLYDFTKPISHLLANLYLNGTRIGKLKPLEKCIKDYIDSESSCAILNLSKILPQFNINKRWAGNLLNATRKVILSLGYDIDKNVYHIWSLKEIILRYGGEGSFAVWPEIHNYIRLSVYEKRKIDISSISLFWMMYHQRKDYSVINIEEALTVFETKKLITFDKSIDIIIKAQNLSEKGIGHLLTNYIELHEPKIIGNIINKYNPNDLWITWFDLSPKYIDVFPDNLFNHALYKQLLHYHEYSKEIDFNEIENVLLSNRKFQLINSLNIFRYQIKISSNHPYFKELKNLNCCLKINNPKEKDNFQTDVKRNYNNGILNSASIHFIKENNLDITDIAGRHDGLSTLGHLEFYENFSKGDIRKNILNLIYYAIIGKIESTNIFPSLFYFPGNIPKLIKEYQIEIDYKQLKNNFMKFLELSLILKN